MKRTTLSLAPSLLKAIKELARQEGITMRKVMCDLLELGLKTHHLKSKPNPRKHFHWHSQSMKAKVDYDDKDELIKILDLRK